MTRLFLTLAFAAAAVVSSAQSQYAAKVTVNSGNSFVVKQLKIQGDRLYAETGQSSTALSMISAIEFRFSGISLSMCESMFEKGDRKSLENLLEQSVGPVAGYSYLPTNLGDYLMWMLRARYWNGNAAGFGTTFGQIRQSKETARVEEGSLYFALTLLDQGKVDNAKTVLASVENPDIYSVPMAEYIRGRIALEEGDPRRAMRHVARVLAFHSRDAEWLPPATVLEARVYQRLGQPEKAAAVAEELMIAYPDSRWSREGEKIKMESTGN